MTNHDIFNYFRKHYLSLFGRLQFCWMRYLDVPDLCSMWILNWTNIILELNKVVDNSFKISFFVNNSNFRYNIPSSVVMIRNDDGLWPFVWEISRASIVNMCIRCGIIVVLVENGFNSYDWWFNFYWKMIRF